MQYHTDCGKRPGRGGSGSVSGSALRGAILRDDRNTWASATRDIPKGWHDESPAFQRRETVATRRSPERTVDIPRDFSPARLNVSRDIRRPFRTRLPRPCVPSPHGIPSGCRNHSRLSLTVSDNLCGSADRVSPARSYGTCGGTHHGSWSDPRQFGKLTQHRPGRKPACKPEEQHQGRFARSGPVPMAV